MKNYALAFVMALVIPGSAYAQVDLPDGVFFSANQDRPCVETCQAENGRSLQIGAHGARKTAACVATPHGTDWQGSVFIGYTWDRRCRIAVGGRDRRQTPYRCVCMK